jgi:hypothetical protein
MSKKNGSGRKPVNLVMSDAEIAAQLSMQYRVPMVKLDEYEIDPAIIALVPRDLCWRHRVIPVSRQGSSLIVAMAVQRLNWPRGIIFLRTSIPSGSPAKSARKRSLGLRSTMAGSMNTPNTADDTIVARAFFRASDAPHALPFAHSASSFVRSSGERSIRGA